MADIRAAYGTTARLSPDQADPPDAAHPARPPRTAAAATLGLRRGLSARQVQMIAVAGTIGTGLFLGTGRSLAQGGPASLLICYALVGALVYVTLLLLGEMATQYPVAGSFGAYTARFVSPAYAFALQWNYWFNDAVSVAGDLTAAQLVLQFWAGADAHAGAGYGWLVSAAFWVLLVGVNAVHVGAYGELEYWLSSLKVVTVVLFILTGAAVNLGLNREHAFIGARYWRIDGAPFVGGFGGFARVFVTASFAYGGTESLGITAGETRNPSKTMPRVVKFVFWRILLFYILSIALIGLNVPWDYPNLSTKSTTTSPFTIVFSEAGSHIAASAMNAVVLSSALSAGNHALFAGTRVLYGLASGHGRRRQAPALFARTTARGVPLPALLATASVSLLCVASAYVGGGVLWGWLQTLVGVSNQIAWLSIGLASRRFRKAWRAQGRPLSELKFRAGWTWGWGPPFVIVSTSALILFQGWSSVIPRFDPVEFVSLYAELPLMAAMTLAWLVLRRRTTALTSASAGAGDDEATPLLAPPTGGTNGEQGGQPWWRGDLVDLTTVDLRADEYDDDDDVGGQEDEDEEARREKRLHGGMGWAWWVWYAVV